MYDTQKRYDDCFALELSFNGESFVGYLPYNKDFNIHWTEIQCDSEEQWQNKMKWMTAELNARKVNIEKRNHERTCKERL